MAGDTQRGIHHTAIEEKECGIEAQKADNAANEKKYPADGLAQKTADAGSAPGGGYEAWISREDSLVGRHGAIRLPQKDLLVRLFLFGYVFGVEVVHLEKLNCCGVGNGRVDAFTVHKLTQLGNQRHTLLTEEKIDQCFARIGMGGLAA